MKTILYPFLSFAYLITSAQEAEDIRGPKGLVEIPEPPNYLLWTGIAILVALIAVLLWKWIAKKSEKPGISAANRAISQINEAESLISEPDTEPFVIKVTEAIRVYIEKSFNVAAPRQTTEEFLREIHARPEGGIYEFQEELGDFLRSCDAVKFGKADLELEARKNLLANARTFVESTRNRSKRDD
ncbi:MAG: hypothetical protein P1U89_14880 [Verrucomicrobiales bacterium]|nr:hypothetical protein [Verrucomicrobiales bacterium]